MFENIFPKDRNRFVYNKPKNGAPERREVAGAKPKTGATTPPPDPQEQGVRAIERNMKAQTPELASNSEILKEMRQIENFMKDWIEINSTTDPKLRSRLIVERMAKYPTKLVRRLSRYSVDECKIALKGLQQDIAQLEGAPKRSKHEEAIARKIRGVTVGGEVNRIVNAIWLGITTEEFTRLMRPQATQKKDKKQKK